MLGALLENEDQTDFAIMECTKFFAPDFIYECTALLNKYEILDINLSPIFFGHPYSRERTFKLFIKKETRVILKPVQEFVDMFERTVQTFGTIYFAAQKEFVEERRRQYATKRLLPQEWPWPQ